MPKKIEKESILKELDTIIKRAKSLKKVPEDIDDVALEKINSSRFFLEDTFDVVLSNQKKRGKEFLSDDEIDNLIDKIKKEEGLTEIKKFNEYNEMPVTDLYGNPKERHKAFEFAEKNWPEEVLHLLLETKNDIESILNKVSNLGNYSMDEWIGFFTKIRKYGI